jgi:hypothetical protein
VCASSSRHSSPIPTPLPTLGLPATEAKKELPYRNEKWSFLLTYPHLHTSHSLPLANSTSYLQTMTAAWTRLVRFLPKGATSPLIGQPIDAHIDVGLASLDPKSFDVEVWSANSILDPSAKPTGRIERVDRLLSPLAESEVGTIRCIGLNVSALAFSHSRLPHALKPTPTFHFAVP